MGSEWKLLATSVIIDMRAYSREAKDTWGAQGGVCEKERGKAV